MAARTAESGPSRGSDQADERTAIFISYGIGQVIGNSEPIYEALANHFGRIVLRSDDWSDDPLARLRTCRVVVPIIEPTLEGGFNRIDDATDPLQRELEVARAEGIAILPALVGGTGKEPVPMLLKLPPKPG